MTIRVQYSRRAQAASNAAARRIDVARALTSAIEADDFEFFTEGERNAARQASVRQMPHKGSPMIDAGARMFAINWT